MNLMRLSVMNTNGNTANEEVQPEGLTGGVILPQNEI
jgi:hypothetical protein